jgi:multiple sugar transport system substrate-binding protein
LTGGRKVKRTRTFFLVCIAVFLCTAAIATGGGAEDGETSTKASERITLNVAGGIAAEVFEPWFSMFTEQHPDIAIDWIPLDGPKLEEYLKARTVSGGFPDVFIVNSNEFGANLAKDGWIADLKNTTAANNTIGALLEPFTLSDGQIYGIPIGLATTFFYINKDMFNEAGITKLPENWPEFLKAAEMLKQAGLSPIIMSPSDSGNSWFSHLFAQNVVSKYPDYVARIQAGTLDFSMPEVTEIFSRMKMVVDKGYAHPAYMSTGYNEQISLFLQKKAAILFNGSWMSKQIFEADFEVGVMLPPVNEPDQQKMVVVAPETGWTVGAKSENYDAAVQLLEWMNGPGYAYYQRAMGSVPPFKVTEGELDSDVRITDLLQQVADYPGSRLWFQYLPTELMPLVPKLIEQVFQGSVTPAEAAEHMQDVAMSSK